MEAETPPISPWGYLDAVPESDLPDPVPEGTRYWGDIFGGWFDERTWETSWAAVPKPCDPPIDSSFAKTLHPDPGEELDTDALGEVLSTFRQTTDDMKTEKPTPPEGYTLMLGKDVPRNAPADGLLNWCGMAWVPTEYSAQSCYPNNYYPEAWFAVPTSTPPTDPKASQSISEEAAAVVAGDRADDYGDVNESFARIAKLWSAYTGTTINPWDVAQMMILLKVSRAKTSTKRDTLVDIVGYAECAGQLKQAD